MTGLYIANCFFSKKRTFEEPIRLNLHDLPHVFFAGQYQFEVHNPFGLLLKHAAAWMYMHCLILLDCAV